MDHSRSNWPSFLSNQLEVSALDPAFTPSPTKPHRTLKVTSAHFLDGLWTASFHTPRLAYQNPPSIPRALLTMRARSALPHSNSLLPTVTL